MPPLVGQTGVSPEGTLGPTFAAEGPGAPMVTTWLGLGTAGFLTTFVFLIMVLISKPTDSSLLFTAKVPAPAVAHGLPQRKDKGAATAASRLPRLTAALPRTPQRSPRIGSEAPPAVDSPGSDSTGDTAAHSVRQKCHPANLSPLTARNPPWRSPWWPSELIADPLSASVFLVGLAGFVSMLLPPWRAALNAHMASLGENLGEETLDSNPSPSPPFDQEAKPHQETVHTVRSKEDVWSLLGLGSALFLLAGILGRKAILQAPAYALSAVFVTGYLGIICEEHIAFNKAGVGLLMAAVLWAIRNATANPIVVHGEIHAALAETGEVVFFLLGAMSIVQIVEAHNGWTIITNNIKTRNKALLAWLLAFMTFWMSAVLDNLTSTVVMLSLLRKLIPAGEVRRLFGAIVVLAANAGGAWTPIGDVTTTMLWIGGLITTLPTMVSLFLPSVISVVVPLALMTLTLPDLRGSLPPLDAKRQKAQLAPWGRLVFTCGLTLLTLVPAFKAVTGLPPYLGMLTGLGLLWLLTDVLHCGDASRRELRARAALSRIDTEGMLFFFGVLMSVACLNSAGILAALSRWLSVRLPHKAILAGALGLASAVVDNVPLVAAVMGMFSNATVPVNDPFWQLVAYCAGTGGSVLVIGSAAGVAFMGMEHTEFGWYTRRISFFALVGYFAGMAAYFAMRAFLPLPVV